MDAAKVKKKAARIPGTGNPIRWTDSHCHLTDDRFADDVEEVVGRAWDAGVERIVVVGDRLESSREALAMAERFHGLYATAGVHPHHAGEWSDAAARELREICLEEPVVALGEIGLDYYYDFSPREAQVEAFLEQAELGRELGLPLVMHCREAYGEFLELVRRHDLASVGGVVHCFSGTPAEALELAEMGFFLGVGGVLTFKGNDLGREAVRGVPLESLVLETDAPYLAPAPKRGKRNEPAWMVRTAERLAELVGMEPRDLARILDENTSRLFRISTCN